MGRIRRTGFSILCVSQPVARPRNPRRLGPWSAGTVPAWPAVRLCLGLAAGFSSGGATVTNDCRYCDAATPLERIGAVLVCPTCARVTPAPEDGPPAPEDAVGEAQPAPLDFDRLRSVRAPSGQFLPGVPGPRLRHGMRASTLLDLPAMAEAHRERCEAIRADLGGDVSTLKQSAIAEAARLSLLVDSMGNDLLTQGVLTGKGRCRAALSAYVMTLDRLQRLMGLLGLERRAKPVDPIEAVQRAVREASE